jgi:hypothetical protein
VLNDTAHPKAGYRRHGDEQFFDLVGGRYMPEFLDRAQYSHPVDANALLRSVIVNASYD